MSDLEVVLNAFRHLRILNLSRRGCSTRIYSVLNAFRHLRILNLAFSFRAADLTECSTPSGI